MTTVELALRDLGAHIAYPEEIDFTARVQRRIEGKAAPLSARRPLVPRLVFVAAAAVVVVAASLAVLPGVRSAVADLLGLGGVSIERGGEAPGPVDLSPDLGRRVSLEEASAAVDFDVLAPAELGSPDRIYLDPLVPGGHVALVYRTRPGLPETVVPGVGALVTEFEGRTEDSLAKKLVDGGNPVRFVSVNGAPAYWITGAPHVVHYIGPDGEPRTETVRLAGNVLLWSRDGVTYRVESRLGLADALRIAESIH